MAKNGCNTVVAVELHDPQGDRLEASSPLDKAQASVRVGSTDEGSEHAPQAEKPALPKVPLSWKIASVVLVSCIGFGSNWSSGITGAMKSTLRKQLHIDNTKYALLEASEDFMVTLLILPAGIVTDRIGGAASILYGNALYSVGSILVAAAATRRSFRFMVGGRVVLALGDIATKVAQYKIFSSWFSPSHGFASTLALELALGKVGAFVGKSTANVIAERTGDFAWTFWTAVFMNLFTNAMTVVFFLFTKVAHRRFSATADPATGERLTERNETFRARKVLDLPWVFWSVLAYSMFETTTASVFSSNATELIEQKFRVGSVTAGWYSATIQYAGFFLVPCIGLSVDALGNRINLMTLTGVLVSCAMLLVNYGTTERAAIAGFAVYAVGFCFGPTVIIDGIRTAIWDGSTFGTAYALKLLLNNAMTIVLRIVTGAIQDADDDAYTRVTRVYVFFAICALAVSLVLNVGSRLHVDLGRLQWTRRQRLRRGEVINAARARAEGPDRTWNKRLSTVCFCALVVLVLAAWGCYFYGVATGNNA